MSNKVLNDKEVVRIMREEWAKIKAAALQEVSFVRDGKPLVTPGLKIVDNSGNLYTINSVGNEGAVLEDPTGAMNVVPWSVIERDFKLQ
jgi:hypothetical protein